MEKNAFRVLTRLKKNSFCREISNICPKNKNDKKLGRCRMLSENIHPCEKALHSKGLRFSIVATYKIKRFSVQDIATPGFCIGLMDEIFMLRQIT